MGAPHDELKFDRFRVVRTLGAGGMGVVYEAVDSLRKEAVALKTLRRVDADSLYRFKREFRSLADLSHPNLVTLYELFATDDDWFFTMELVAGRPFHEWITGPPAERGPSTPDDQTIEHSGTRTRELGGIGGSRPRPEHPRAVSTSAPALTPSAEARLRSTLLQLAEALVFLHDAGWLHRDVKPSNVLVTAEGRVVVLDFGVVTELRSRTEDVVAGTPAYMAPEQVQSARPTAASDWYSFGVMLYEVLAGRRPFRGGATTVLGAKLLEQPDTLAVVAPQAPGDLASLCSDLLRLDPADRPTGREVLRRLGRTLSTRPPRPASTSRPMSSTPPPREESLVGREQPLAVLDAAYARAAESGRAVFVDGPSAIGKTALLDAFLDRLARQTAEPAALVLRGRCYERESVPYKALDSLVDALCRHLRELTSESIARILPEDIAALAAAFPVVRGLEAVAKRASRPPETWRAPGHQEKLKLRALAALKQLLGHLARDRRVVLFIDDLQWGDLDSAPLLGALVAAGGPPLLFLGAFRTEHRSESALLRGLFEAASRSSERVLEELHLQPLVRADLERLAGQLLRGTHLGLSRAAELAGQIAQAAQGSAYFAEELARYAATGKAGMGTDSMSLHAVLLARASRLSPEARRVLDVIAVAGAPLPRQVLEVAAGASPNSRGFVELAVAHFTKASAVAEDDAVETTHDAVREAIAGPLPAEELRRLHLTLAKALESVGGKWSDTHRLAHHFFLAWPDAPAARVFELCRDATVAAAKTYAYDQAYVHLQRARAVADGAGLDVDFAFEQLSSDVAARSGHIEAAAASFRRALTMAPTALARAELHLGLAKIFLGRLDADASQRECSLGLAEVGQRRVRPSKIGLVLSIALWLSGLWISRVQRGRIGSLVGEERERHRAAVALFSHCAKTAYFQMDRLTQVQVTLRVFPIAMLLGDSTELVDWLSWVSMLFAMVKRPRVALRLGGEARELAARLHDPLAAARAMQYRAHGFHFLGRPVEAEAVMRECLETQGHWLENADFLTAVADMAWNMMMRGKPAEGWRWIQAGLERAAVDGVQSRFARGHTYRCYAGPLLAQLGRSAEGRQHLDAYREILRGVSDDRWRHGQWLAHRSLFLVVSGAFGDELEEAFAAFGALRLSPRTLPLQLRHFYVAQAMARAHQLKAAGVNPPRSVQRCWSEAREALAQAASHATLRGHLRALEAGVALHQSSHRRASRLLAEAERLARETENAWILSETSSLRAVMRRDADR